MHLHASRWMCILTKEHMTVWLISRKHLSHQEGPAAWTDKDLANGPRGIIYGTDPSQRHTHTQAPKTGEKGEFLYSRDNILRILARGTSLCFQPPLWIGKQQVHQLWEWGKKTQGYSILYFHLVFRYNYQTKPVRNVTNEWRHRHFTQQRLYSVLQKKKNLDNVTLISIINPWNKVI